MSEDYSFEEIQNQLPQKATKENFSNWGATALFSKEGHNILGKAKDFRFEKVKGAKETYIVAKGKGKRSVVATAPRYDRRDVRLELEKIREDARKPIREKYASLRDRLRRVKDVTKTMEWEALHNRAKNTERVIRERVINELEWEGRYILEDEGFRPSLVEKMDFNVGNATDNRHVYHLNYTRGDTWNQVYVEYTVDYSEGEILMEYRHGGEEFQKAENSPFSFRVRETEPYKKF